MNKTYLITYSYYLNDGTKISNKKIKVKNSMSDLHAKIKLEQYLKKHSSDFGNLIVHSCVEDVNIFGDIFSSFNDIFGGKL